MPEEFALNPSPSACARKKPEADHPPRLCVVRTARQLEVFFARCSLPAIAPSTARSLIHFMKNKQLRREPALGAVTVGIAMDREETIATSAFGPIRRKALHRHAKAENKLLSQHICKLESCGNPTLLARCPIEFPGNRVFSGIGPELLLELFSRLFENGRSSKTVPPSRCNAGSRLWRKLCVHIAKKVRRSLIVGASCGRASVTMPRTRIHPKRRYAAARALAAASRGVLAMTSAMLTASAIPTPPAIAGVMAPTASGPPPCTPM